MYALDSNTIIYFLKGLGRVKENLLQTSPQEIFIPSIAVLELEFGAKKSGSEKKRKQLHEFLDVCSILSFGQEEAKVAAKVKLDLETRGLPIGSHDLLIAASALTRRYTLVTHNLREFKRIKGLSIEDWF